ncbi:MAG: hypothetical protein ACKVW3_01045 [Phycisphaerales bacterium]
MLRLVRDDHRTPESYPFPGVSPSDDARYADPSIGEVDDGARDAAWHVERAMRDVERRFLNLRRLLGDVDGDPGPRAA